MKKLVSVLMLIILLSFSLINLTGCSDSNESENNEVSEKQISNNDESVVEEKNDLGKVVTNYTANDQEWKVFYEDDETGRIYLITSDYVESKYLANSYKNGASNWEGGYSEERIYNYEWNDTDKAVLETNNREDELFMATGYELNDKYKNSRCVSTLLNTDNWKDFVDNTYADYAIGGPTIEMLVASWNKKGYKKLYADNTNEYGYYIGAKEKSEDFFWFFDEKDELYVPHDDYYKSCSGYWIASPSANSLAPGARVFTVSYSRQIGFAYPSDATYSVRPVVVLKEGTKLKTNSDGTVTIK